MLIAAVFSTLLVTNALGATVTEGSRLTTDIYDYIIIGGMCSPLDLNQALSNLYTSWDGWTRRRESANGGSENYRAGSGGRCEVS